MHFDAYTLIHVCLIVRRYKAVYYYLTEKGGRETSKASHQFAPVDVDIVQFNVKIVLSIE